MKETLRKLQEEIDNADLGAEKKAEFKSLIDKLMLEQREKEGLLSDLSRSIEEFESSHPQFTGLMSRVSNFLSNTGI